MKNWWALVVILALVAIVGIASYLFAGKNGETVVPDGTTTIQMPNGGPKLKVIFNGPPGLEIKWKKILAENDQVGLVGTLKNVSDQTFAVYDVGFFLDGVQKAYMRISWAEGGLSLGPGEETAVLGGFLVLSRDAKVIDVILRFKVAIAPTPSPTTAQDTLGPGQVLEKFWRLPREGKFEEAMELMGPESRRNAEANGGVKKIKEDWQKQPEFELVVTNVLFHDTSPPQAIVYFRAVFFADKSTADSQMTLYKINGEWKVGK